MKKLITTFCLVALTSVVANAQTDDVRAAKAQEVKKEAVTPAKGTDAAKTDSKGMTRAEYEEFRQKQLEALKAEKETPKATTPVKKVGAYTDAKTVVKPSGNKAVNATGKAKKDLTPEEKKLREEKLKQDN